MKKLLFIAAAAFIYSCGGGNSEGASENATNAIEKDIKDFEGKVDTYCTCVAEKGVDACSAEHTELMDAHSYIQSNMSSQIENGNLTDEAKISEYRNKTRELFDKKAKCAQDAMNKPQ